MRVAINGIRMLSLLAARGISPDSARTANPVQTIFHHRKSKTFPVQSVLIDDPKTLHRKASLKVLDPLGDRFT
jgi:hypothetical protein